MVRHAAKQSSLLRKAPRLPSRKPSTEPRPGHRMSAGTVWISPSAEESRGGDNYAACTLFRPSLVRNRGIPVSLGSSPKRSAESPATYPPLRNVHQAVLRTQLTVRSMASRVVPGTLGTAYLLSRLSRGHMGHAERPRTDAPPLSWLFSVTLSKPRFPAP
jgi:hypothetical protein